MYLGGKHWAKPTSQIAISLNNIVRLDGSAGKAGDIAEKPCLSVAQVDNFCPLLLLIGQVGEGYSVAGQSQMNRRERSSIEKRLEQVKIEPKLIIRSI